MIDKHFEFTPTTCPNHKGVFLGWVFDDKPPARIISEEECMLCGLKMMGRRVKYARPGMSSFDIEDPRLLKGGMLGEDYMKRLVEQELTEKYGGDILKTKDRLYFYHIAGEAVG